MTGIALLIIAGVVILAIILVVGIYNSLVRKRIETQNAWSQIDVQMKRRHDLVPNLVETVKGYAKHERETLERVIQARNAAINAQTVGEHAAAENALTGALKTIFALSEAYPDLKANQNFLNLQEELTATENRIGFSRQHYNDSVSVYNTALMSFPANAIGGMFGFQPAEFWQLDVAEVAAVRQAPKVQF
jgi:LemA protein